MSDDVAYEPPPRELISGTVWESIQKLSPAGGVDPPGDSTNQFANDERAIRLGQFLFFEPAISGNGEVSCASCHVPEDSFTDTTTLPTEGITGSENAPGRRTPTLLNVAYHRWYFWDGRADTLWGQAVLPYESPVEMGSTRLKLAHFIYDTPDVREAYETIFGDLPPESSISPFPEDGRPIDDPTSPDEIAQADAWNSMRPRDQDEVNAILANVMKAIAAYEMQLVSFDAPFDRFVEEVRAAPADPTQWRAISPEAQEGMRLFVEVAGCLECHNTPLFTDGKFHNIGLPTVDWADPEDPGREAGLPQAKEFLFSSAGPYSDDPDGPHAATLRALPVDRKDTGAFKTPSLRSVAGRAPYMHAGQLEDLDAVMEFYNDPPEDAPAIGSRDSDVRALDLSEEKLAFFVAFLESLQGAPVDESLMSQPPGPSLD